MLRYLLDTNMVSDMVRHPQGIVANRIAVIGEDTIATSIVVAAELRYGAAKAGSSRLADRIDQVLSAMEVLSLEPPADRHYAEIRLQLTRQGAPVGPNDLLIAAHALATGLVVVTANVREFSRIPGLGVENWL